MATELELALSAFHEGKELYAYRLLGAHGAVLKNIEGTVFRTFAPGADAVFVTGDHNGWSESTPMRRVTKRGVWEAFVPRSECGAGMKYKYMTVSKGKIAFKADPYAVYTGCGAEMASFVPPLSNHRWSDDAYLAARKKTVREGKGPLSYPMNIYRAHLPSFRKRGAAFCNYRELADTMAPYVKKLGFTHIELMPLAEYADGEVSSPYGFFAPTSRLGTFDDLKYFVNTLHRYGIGVIFEVCLSGFSLCEQGLDGFDASKPYGRRGEFDLSSPEVRSFLLSSAIYWAEEFHADGISVVDSARLLEKNGARDHRGAELYRTLNKELGSLYPDIITLADGAGGVPMATKPTYSGGLGFTYNLNRAWCEDIGRAVALPLHDEARAKPFYPLFSYSEDSVVTLGTGLGNTIIDSINGAYEEKFAVLRLMQAYLAFRPGKKLSFMGSEFAQFARWDPDSSLEWFMTGFDMHAKLLKYTAELNHLYLENACFWERDDSYEGCMPLVRGPYPAVAFSRCDRGGDTVVCVFNFSSDAVKDLTLNVNSPGLYSEIFNTDAERFGGHGRRNLPQSARSAADGRGYTLTLDIPPLSAIAVKRERYRRVPSVRPEK